MTGGSRMMRDTGSNRVRDLEDISVVMAVAHRSMAWDPAVTFSVLDSICDCFVLEVHCSCSEFAHRQEMAVK